MAKVKPENTVRFAWWGDEEAAWSARRTTSTSLSEEEGAIALYLNFDMIGSPNYGLFIFDGDGPTLPAPVRAGRV